MAISRTVPNTDLCKVEKNGGCRYGSTRVENEYKHLKTEKDYGRYQYPVRY
ncbi:hypothetical protein HMPREF2533_03274 [Bacteroides fragilis]|nr:hypothetical protein HMPREF2530_03274 [Bacteroides fragilis]KXU43248.1 hypothetical protein HMPREF2533_03274 [Bacteroides fragilis]